MKDRDIKNLKNIVDDLESAETGAMISLSQEEINSLKSILESLKSSTSKDKILNQLLYNMKERANNFSFETEMMWRKIEKAEKLLEEK